MPKFLISILSLNRCEGAKQCVEAVLDGGDNYMLLLTDNASSDGTYEFFKATADKLAGEGQAFREIENQGFIGPNERAFRIAQELRIPYLVLLNDDTRPPVGWLDRLAAALENDPGCALAGAVGACCEITPEFHGTGGGRLEYIEGSCLIADVQKVRRVRPTLFDPNLTFMYGEDADLSLTMRRAGYRICQVDMNIQHVGAASRLANPQLKAKCENLERQNHKYLLKKWAHYMKIRRFDHRIIVRRWHALGDVVLVTPFVRALRKHSPLSQIIVETKFPEIFYGNASVAYASNKVFLQPDDLVIDLDMASENGPMRHFVSSYFSKGPIGLQRPEEYITEIHYDREWEPPGIGRWCAMHVGPTTWKCKNWTYDRFNAIGELLAAEGFKICLVGNGSDGDVVHDVDYRDKTGIKELAAIIAGCDLFVGVDSFPMHVAQAVGTPTVGIFGVTESKYIMTDGSPHVGCDADPVQAPRSGERHRIAGASWIDEDGTAIGTVTIGQVWSAIKSLIT